MEKFEELLKSDNVSSEDKEEIRRTLDVIRRWEEKRTVELSRREGENEGENWKSVDIL